MGVWELMRQEEEVKKEIPLPKKIISWKIIVIIMIIEKGRKVGITKIIR